MFATHKLLGTPKSGIYTSAVGSSPIGQIYNAMKAFARPKRDAGELERERFHQRFSALLRSVELATSGNSQS